MAGEYIVKDYVNVPKVNDFNVGGEMIIVYDNYNPYRVAYQSENEYSVRAGVYVYKEDKVIRHKLFFVSPSPINYIDLYVQNPYLSIYGTINAITTPLPNNLLGYYAEIDFNMDRLSTGIKGQKVSVKWWDNLFALFQALSTGDTPTVDSGVVVTAVASPVTPSEEGVIVYATASILDPNRQGGESEPGGGNGTFNDTSDPIPIPPLPELSATDTGLVTLFRPSSVELKSLASYLWTNVTDIFENLNKFFVNPTDYLISLNIFPCNPPVGEARTIHIGALVSTITMPPLVSQWFQHNCGTISLPEYWGSALDYSPNTKVSLFLPFIGSVALNTDEVMGKRIGIVYRIDLLSGQCVAMVTIDGLNVQTSVVYQFTGECSVPVPLTGSDWSRIYSAAFGAIGTAITGSVAAGASGAAAGGATAALAGANAAEAASNAGLAYSMINDTSKGVRGVSVMREQMLQASQMALEAGRNAASAPTRVSNGVRATRIANTLNNTLGAVMSGKGIVQHSGTVSGSAGMLGVKVPYLLIEYPNQSLAKNYKHYVGYPSNMLFRLGDLSGYTEVEQVITNGLNVQTDAEMSEIIDILKGGVYL